MSNWFKHAVIIDAQCAHNGNTISFLLVWRGFATLAGTLAVPDAKCGDNHSEHGNTLEEVHVPKQGG